MDIVTVAELGGTDGVIAGARRRRSVAAEGRSKGILQGFPGVRGPAAYISQPPSEYPLLAAAERLAKPVRQHGAGKKFRDGTRYGPDIATKK